MCPSGWTTTEGRLAAALRKTTVVAAAALRDDRVAEPGRGAQGVGAVGDLPREVRILAAEVAVGGGLLVDRPVQLEVLAEGAGAQVEVLVDEPGDRGAVDLLSPERLDH